MKGNKRLKEIIKISLLRINYGWERDRYIHIHLVLIFILKKSLPILLGSKL